MLMTTFSSAGIKFKNVQRVSPITIVSYCICMEEIWGIYTNNEILWHTLFFHCISSSCLVVFLCHLHVLSLWVSHFFLSSFSVLPPFPLILPLFPFSHRPPPPPPLLQLTQNMERQLINQARQVRRVLTVHKFIKVSVNSILGGICLDSSTLLQYIYC